MVKGKKLIYSRVFEKEASTVWLTRHMPVRLLGAARMLAGVKGVSIEDMISLLIEEGFKTIK